MVESNTNTKKSQKTKYVEEGGVGGIYSLSSDQNPPRNTGNDTNRMKIPKNQKT